MGEVVAFRMRKEARRAPANGGAAEILFFTGVRYQRDEPVEASDAPQDSSPHGRRGKVRNGRRHKT